MTPIITRVLEFDAGHRLLGHEGKCRHVHGHRYRVEIRVRAAELDQVGRVIDFSAVKDRVGGWLDLNWDHGFIAQVGDPILAFLRAQGSRYSVIATPPTAENMVLYLRQVATDLLAPEVEVVGVRLFETPNCWADA